MLDSDQRAPGTRKRSKKGTSRQSHGGRAPKLACGFGPLQVLRFCNEWQEEVKAGRKGKEKEIPGNNKKLERKETKQPTTTKQKEKDETKREIPWWTASKPKSSFGHACVWV
jgi:hypothetical protein